MANEIRVRDFQLPVLTLTADYDPGTDTTISAAELEDYPVIGSTNHLAVWLNREGVGGNRPYLRYITAHSASATNATVGAAPENLVTPYAISTGAKGHHGMTIRDIVRATSAFITGSDLALNAGTPTNWQNIPTITNTRDLTLLCFADDRVQVGASFRCDGTGTLAFFDVWSDPDGTPYAWATRGAANNAHFGIQSWTAPAVATTQAGGGILRTITSAEIVSRILTLRMKYRLNSAATKALVLNSGVGLNWEFFAVNHGPQNEEPVYS